MDKTVRPVQQSTKYANTKPQGPRIPLRQRGKAAYRATEKASMRIPARRFVLGAGAVVGAGYVMNKMMNRRKDNFYTHYYDY